MRTPGTHADMQEAGWTNVVEAGHAKGGRITLQSRHGYRANAFRRRGIAYLHIAEPGRPGGVELSDAFRYRMSDEPRNMVIR